MAISDTQKLDALYKKFGFGVAKTDTAGNKSPSNEAITSTLLVRGDKIWNESDLIPTTPPTTTTTQIKVRTITGDGRVAATADSTVVPSSRTWLTGVTDWIPPQFGVGYAVKVYADTAGAANPQSTGTLLTPDGSNADGFIFDYASGVLNFLDTNLPTALTGKAIFIVGYTYVGSVGLKNSPAVGDGLTVNSGAISTSVTNGDLVLSGNGNGIVTVNDSLTVNENLVVNGTSALKGATTVGTSTTNANLTVNGDVSATGNGSVGGNLVVSGDLTVNGTQTIVNTEVLKVADNIITLNSGIGSVAPTQNAGLEIDRGTEGLTTLIQWNETTDKVEIMQGSSLVEVASVNDVAAAKTALETEIGGLSSLTTDAKNTVVAAINEVDLHANSIYTVLGVTADATQTGFDGMNFVVTNSTIKAAITSLDTQLKTTASQVDGNIGVLTALTTTTQATLVAAINEVDTHANDLYAALGSFITEDANSLVISGTNFLDTATTVSLALTALDTQLKTTASQVDGNIGTLTSLTTTTKSTLVAAINEIDTHANSIYTVLGVTADASTSGLTSLNYVTDNSSITVAIAALDNQLKTTTSQVDGNIGALTDLTTTTKATLVAAINEVNTHADNLYSITGSFATQDANALVISGTNYLDTATTVSLALTALDTQLKTTASQVDGNIGVLTTLTTTSKGTLVSAINEIDAHANSLYSAAGSFLSQDASSLVITGTNYLNSDTTLTAALTTLDSTLKTRVDHIAAGAFGAVTDGYAADATTNYITTADSLKNADKALDAKLFETVTNVGVLTTLTTDDKTTIVKAINEVDLHANNLYAALGMGINVDDASFSIGETRYLTENNLGAIVGGTTLTVSSALYDLAINLSRVEDGVGDWTALATTAKTVVPAINELDSNINAEVTRATTTEGTLSSLTTSVKTNLVAAINSEVTRATSAESGVSTRLNNINTAAGITGDAYNADATTNYLTAATSLTNADKLLDAKLKSTIVDYASTVAGKGTALVGYKGYVEADVNIVSPTIEVAAGSVQDALDDIAASVNIKIHELESRYVKAEVSAAEKSDVYTLVHNLDTEFVDVAVQVFDAVDNVWRFDIVVVEVVDVNTVTVSLAAGIAQQIRYVIHGY